MSMTLAQLEARAAEVANGVDVAFTLTCSALVIIMQVGFAYVEAGNVRVKNVRSILLKNVVDYVIGGLAFCFFSSALARGTSWHGLFGTDGWGGVQPKDDPTDESLFMAQLLFNALFACTTSTIISGAIAERMRLSAYITISTLSPIILYAFPAHWVWNSDGILQSPTRKYMQVSDFAGGAVVHMTGGIAALTAAWFVGPRIGRYSMSRGKEKTIDGHSVVLSGLGTWLILFGWLGFNAGSSGGVSTADGAYLAAVGARNTFISVITGALVSVVYHVLILGKLNLGEMFNSMLAGAAAITAGAGYVEAWAALIIGIIGTVTYIISVPIIGRKMRIDDPLNAASVHMSAATAGFLLVGVFDENEGLYVSGEGWKLASQFVGMTIIGVHAVFWTSLICIVYTLLIGPVRVEERIEVLGCDIELDGIAAYENSNEQHIKYEVIASNKDLSEEFNFFLKSIYCYQNIEFLDAIKAFEVSISNPSVDSKTEAQAIYDRFICPDGSSDPVAIPEWQVLQIKRVVDKFNQNLTATALSKSAEKRVTGSQASTSESALLVGLFTNAKQEVISLLEQTIKTHFCHTPVYQRFVRLQKKSKSQAPLHWIARKAWCFTPAKRVKYGRARPFDPRKQFKHTEQLDSEDSMDSGDEVDDDDANNGHMKDFASSKANKVEPSAYEENEDGSDDDE